MIWYYVIIWVATLVIGELLRPKPKFDTPRPSALGDFQVPTAEESRVIPVIFGTCLVKGPNVTWYGDLKVVPITEKVKTGLFSSKRITKGYKYYMGMQLSLCHGPIDEFIESRWGDRTSTPNIVVGPDVIQLTFNDEELFGGEDREGGISGNMDLYVGTTTQTASAYLNSATGVPNPAYRTVCYAVMKGMYIGNSSYIKQNAFVLRRCPNQLGLTGGKHNINGDANPACVLYEIKTNAQWGCGFDPSQVDIASFIAAGNTLFNEGLGVSFQIQAASSAIEIEREILRHVDGVVYSDPETGLLTFKLARADYDVTTLDVLDDTNCEEMEFSRGSWEETINTIRVKIIDRSQDFTERPIPAQNLANIQARNGWIEAEDYDFNMFSNVTAGMKTASRVLKTVSYPLARMQTTVNRKAYKFRPGTVVKVTWPKYGITALVCRITNIDYGQYKDGKIRIDLVEDIFHTPFNAFDPPSPTGWIKPSLSPVANTLAKVLEVPYYVLKNSLDPATFATLPSSNSYVLLFLQRPATQNYAFNIYDSPDNVTINYNKIGQDLYTPTMQLNGAIVWNATALVLDSLVGDTDDITAGAAVSLVLIDDEWMLLQAFDPIAGTATVKRGLLDTIPVPHADNAKMWVYAGVNGFAAIEKPISRGSTRWYRETGVAVDGETDLATALTQSHVHAGDWLLPYPPADVKIEGAYYPTEVPGNFRITWSGRNRLAATLKAWTDPHEAPELGTTYTLRVFDNDTNAQLFEITGLTTAAAGGSFTYPGQTAVVTNYRIELWAVRDNLASRQKFSHVAAVFGYGLLYDQRYGGSAAGVALPRGTSSVNTGDQYRRVPAPVWINGAWHDFEYRHPMISLDNGATWLVEALSTGASNDPPQPVFGSVFYIFGNGYYIAYNGGGSYWVRRDGGAWKCITPSGTPFDGSGNISHMSYDGTRFIMVTGVRFFVATDPSLGSNWTRIGPDPHNIKTIPATALMVLKVGSQYVCIASKPDGTTHAYTSADLITWADAATVPAPIFWAYQIGFAFNGAYFVVYNRPSLSGTTTYWTDTLTVYRSTDFVTWTEIPLPDAVPGTGFGGVFIFNNKVQVIGGDVVWQSGDGLTWTKQGTTRWSTRARVSSNNYRTKADRWSTEAGPTDIFISVPYYIEDGGKLVKVASLTTPNPTLVYPTDGTVLNTSRLGALAGSQTQNSVIYRPYYSNSGFRAENTLESQYGFCAIVRQGSKRYFEVTVAALPFGVSTSILTFKVGVQLPEYPNTFDADKAAILYANGIEYVPEVGDVIGVLADLASGVVELRVKNVAVKTLTGLVTAKNYQPVYDASRAVLDANLGQDPFTYDVTALGYGPWHNS